jgi:hypothetical protein
MLVAIQLGIFRTPALASAWQVYHCDPNTGTSMVEATLVDDTNNRELRGDYDSWYVVDADSTPDESGLALYKATEDRTVEVYGDVNVIITDNTKWVAKRIHLNNGAKLTIWSETGNKDTWGKLSVKTTEDHEAALSVGEGSTLVINGCKVDANSDTDDAAGIGGDKNMSAGTIIINDGDVWGRSKMNAAGIGAGKDDDARKKITLIQNDVCDVEVKSWISETIRAYAYKYFGRKRFPKKLTARNYTSLYKIFFLNRKLVWDTDRHFKAYFKNTQLKTHLYNYDESDFFVWEMMHGGKCGLNIGVMKSCFDITIPYNNRKLLDLLLRVPLEKRISDQHHMDMKKRMNEELFDMNIRVVNLNETSRRKKFANWYYRINSFLPF